MSPIRPSAGAEITTIDQTGVEAFPGAGRHRHGRRVRRTAVLIGETLGLDKETDMSQPEVTPSQTQVCTGFWASKTMLSAQD